VENGANQLDQGQGKVMSEQSVVDARTANCRIVLQVVTTPKSPNNSKWLAERQGAFNRLFLRFGITDGIKRVKLATLLYRANHVPIRTLRKPHPKRARNACHRTSRPRFEEPRRGASNWHDEHVVKNYLRVIYDKLGFGTEWNCVVVRIAQAGHRLSSGVA